MASVTIIRLHEGEMENDQHDLVSNEVFFRVGIVVKSEIFKMMEQNQVIDSSIILFRNLKNGDFKMVNERLSEKPFVVCVLFHLMNQPFS